MSEQQGKDFPVPDPVEFSKNMAKVASQSQRLINDFLKRRSESHELAKVSGIDDFTQIGNAFLDLTTKMLQDPGRLVDAQVTLWKAHLDLWANTARRFMGEDVRPIAQPVRGDKRFRAEEWTENQVFDFIKQSYLLTAKWLQDTVHDVEGLDQKTARKVDFYTKQFVDAMAPTNFVLTNPEVLRVTLESNGENLVKGLNNLIEDIERGEGELHIRMTDMEAFEVGRNLAVTPGKVVYQNDLMQLVQYAPATDEVYSRPLLIIPPWINKFYILDLGPEKSFVKWATEQGYTVFIVSWVNPDQDLAEKTFESYMREGIFEALDAIEKATGEREVNAIGYCIGGTLLGSTLAYMSIKGDDRIKSATFFAAQMDFTEAGELQVFIDEEQLEVLEQKMDEAGGFLEASEMFNTFNMLRANDLIWSFVVNNYLLGRDPFPFDLLYWNADQTNMPKKMHMFYLRQCYQHNNLAEGRMVLGGETLDLGKVKIPMYIQSSREDHIAPYNSVYKSTRLFKGPIRFIVAGSGHIAGVINPPAAKKYQHWTNDELPEDVEDWLAGATEHPGSWWPDWHKWLSRKSGKKVPARKPRDGELRPIEDAPGSYVKTKA